ncbi:RNA polymerase sigma factor [Elusimicrobiota bacterium]
MDPEEAECERLLQAGDPESIPRLLKRFQRPIFSFLYHCVGDRSAAEDLVQEVFVRVWRRRDSYEARGKLASWLFTIARRLAMDFSEKRGRRRTEPLDAATVGVRPLVETLADEKEAPERVAERTATRRRIEEAIAELPEGQRDVFLLREYGGLSFKEIARMSDCPLGTALARMRYAVLKLRKALGDVYA